MSHIVLQSIPAYIIVVFNAIRMVNCVFVRNGIYLVMGWRSTTKSVNWLHFKFIIQYNCVMVNPCISLNIKSHILVAWFSNYALAGRSKVKPKKGMTELTELSTRKIFKVDKSWRITNREKYTLCKNLKMREIHDAGKGWNKKAGLKPI